MKLIFLKSGHIKLYKRENSPYWQMKLKFPKQRAIRSSTGSKILMEASTTAINPNIFDVSKPEGPAASIAPTIITLEIAFVTPIKGLCNAGVTDQTTE